MYTSYKCELIIELLLLFRIAKYTLSIIVLTSSMNPLKRKLQILIEEY